MARHRNSERPEIDSDAVKIAPSITPTFLVGGSAIFGDGDGVATGMNRLRASLPMVEQ